MRERMRVLQDASKGIRMKVRSFVLLLLSSAAWALPLSPSVRTLIPADVRQIISLDYHTGKRFNTAVTLKAQALPDNLKDFESALSNMGVSPDKDVDSLIFVSFEDKQKMDEKQKDKQKLDMVAVASGPFSSMAVLTQIRLQKIASSRYRESDLYPLSKTMTVTVLDEHTLLLGSDNGVKTALSVRDSHGSNVDSNEELKKMIKSVEKSTVWSVLDRKGTQEMLVSTLGNTDPPPDVAVIKQQVLGSEYRMSFKEDVRFYMDVFTSDTVSASKLSALLKAGVLYKKVTANPAQKTALDSVKVTSDRVTPESERAVLKLQFKTEEKQFQTLLRTKCFVDMSTERQELSGLTSGR